MSHDGRHGVARHHAPQQPRLLRTGHRQTSGGTALRVVRQPALPRLITGCHSKLSLRAGAASWWGSWMATTVQTARPFRVRDHGRASWSRVWSGAPGFLISNRSLTETATAAEGSPMSSAWTRNGAASPTSTARHAKRAVRAARPPLLPISRELPCGTRLPPVRPKSRKPLAAITGWRATPDPMGQALDDGLAVRRLGIA